MSPAILAARDRVAQPWKNGGGVTREIAVEPPGAGFDSFGWRISTAVVASDGPFSMFVGVDRVLTVLDGRLGLVVGEAGQRVVLTPSTEPLAFPGDVPVLGDTEGGPVVDLNVMVRRGAWIAGVERRTLSGPAEVRSEAEVCLVWADGPFEGVEAEDVVRLDRGDAVVLRPLAGPTEIIVIELRRA
jgi:environmental stress-induced protein Ves